MNETSNQWSEGDSEIFIDLGEIFVPGRAEQTNSSTRFNPNTS